MNHFKFSVSVDKQFPTKVLSTLFKFLPYFRGCWLFYAPLLSLLSRKNRSVLLTARAQGKTLFAVPFDVSDPYQLNMVKNECFDFGTTLSIWSLLKEGDVFFDVGANCGYISTIASSKVGPAGKVLAIEPNPAAFALLSGRDLKNVTAINKVASRNDESSFTIHKPFYRQTSGSRFLLDKDGEIKSVTLDSLYTEMGKPQVSFVKIDTEGAELLVLEGARQILKECAPFVIAEVSDYSAHFDYTIQAIYDLMQEYRYHHYYFINDGEVSISAFDTPQEGQILFSPRSLEARDFERVL